jgi:poly-gamma-glutamate capsule biosynthesis protein CapA/YwtB (metallophosphatase superfamily)
MGKQINIIVTGDFYGGNRIEKLIKEEKYADLYNDFITNIQNAEIAIANLESTLTNCNKPIVKTGPALKSSPNTIYALKHAGFNLLTLANNHIMDYGEKGLADTIQLCRKNNISTIGAGSNLNEASKFFYQEVKGIKLAFLNFTENEWSTTNGKEPGANPLNPIINHYAIKIAKEKADFVFVIVHGGHEMYELPSPRMKETYRFFIDCRFLRKTDTCSCPKRTLIPEESGHQFLFKTDKYS